MIRFRRPPDPPPDYARLAVEAEHICGGLTRLADAVEANTRVTLALHDQLQVLSNSDRQALGRLDRLCLRLDALLDHLEAGRG